MTRDELSQHPVLVYEGIESALAAASGKSVDETLPALREALAVCFSLG